MRHNQKKILKITIFKVLYDLMIDYGLNFFSASNIEISEKGDSVRIYLNFVQPSEANEIILFLNKKIWYVKKKIAKTHKLARIPWIGFYIDNII